MKLDRTVRSDPRTTVRSKAVRRPAERLPLIVESIVCRGVFDIGSTPVTRGRRWVDRRCHLRCFLQTGRVDVSLVEINSELRRTIAGRYAVDRTFESLNQAMGGSIWPWSLILLVRRTWCSHWNWPRPACRC